MIQRQMLVNINNKNASLMFHEDSKALQKQIKNLIQFHS